MLTNIVKTKTGIMAGWGILALAMVVASTLQARAAAAAGAAPSSLSAETLAPGHMLGGRFMQVQTLAGFSKNLRSQGTFTLEPDKGLIWRVTAPFASTTAITPNGIVQMSGGEEVMRIPASNQPGLSSLYAVLSAAVSGNIAPLKQTFTVQRSGTAQHWQINLTPLQSGKSNMGQIESLTLNGGQYVDTVEITKNGGDSERITFYDQKILPAKFSAVDKSLLETLGK